MIEEAASVGVSVLVGCVTAVAILLLIGALIRRHRATAFCREMQEWPEPFEDEIGTVVRAVVGESAMYVRTWWSSTTVKAEAGRFSAEDVGAPIYATGLPMGTVIVAVQDEDHVTLSAASTFVPPSLADQIP